MENRNSKIYINTLLISIILLLLTLIVLNINDKVYSLEQNKLFKSIKNNYEVKETLYSKIYYTKSDLPYIDFIAQSVDYYTPLLAKDFYLKDTPDVTIIIYNSYKDMVKALDIEDISGIDYPMGVYYAGVINILSPTQWIVENDELIIKDKFVKEGPLIHELAHFFTDYKAKGTYEIWLSEGISLYYENKYTGFVWREDLVEESQHITIEDLQERFNSIDQDLAYRRSYDIVNTYVNKNGESQLQSLIK